MWRTLLSCIRYGNWRVSEWCGCMLSTSLSRQKLKQKYLNNDIGNHQREKEGYNIFPILSLVRSQWFPSQTFDSLYALVFFDSLTTRHSWSQITHFYNNITYIIWAYIAYNAEVPTCTTTFTFIHLFQLLFYTIYTHPHPYLFTTLTSPTTLFIYLIHTTQNNGFQI